MAEPSTPLDCMTTLENLRHSRVLVLASVNLDLDMLAPLHDCISALPTHLPLDVVFYSRGGMVNAARRIALLLRERFTTVRFLVPHYCESAGTLTALSADEIVTAPPAVFSPIDPLLSGGNGDGSPAALSAQDLRLFATMTQDWFGLDEAQARQHALATLCEHFFPSTLTTFHRSTQEVQWICEELLSWSLPDNATLRKAITQQLLFAYHSHHYALTGTDLKRLGLAVTAADQTLLQPLWALGRRFHQQLGGNHRHGDHSYTDCVIVTTFGGLTRQRSNDRASRWLPRSAEQWAREEMPGQHADAHHPQAMDAFETTWSQAV